jgi:hypothetical protein
MKFEKHYSGDNSIQFWDAIWAVEDECIRDKLYEDGCRLQNLESRILSLIEKHSIKEQAHEQN